jgi:hypothetical protein
MVVHMFSISFDHLDKVNVAFDTKKGLIHVLEEDHNQISFMNSIKQVQEQILLRIQQFDYPCHELRWIIYDAYGSAFEYKDGVVHNMNLTHPDIYTSFAKLLKIRSLHFKLQK